MFSVLVRGTNALCPSQRCAEAFYRGYRATSRRIEKYVAGAISLTPQADAGSSQKKAEVGGVQPTGATPLRRSFFNGLHQFNPERQGEYVWCFVSPQPIQINQFNLLALFWSLLLR